MQLSEGQVPSDSPTGGQRPPRRLGRRLFIRSAAVKLAAGGGLLGWTLLVEPHWVEETHHDLAIANLPRPWRGKRLVHLSDLHVGRVSLSYLQATMERVNALRPDLLLITGDLIDRSHGVDGQLVAVLGRLQTDDFPVLGCLGNHDYGKRWQQRGLADRVTEAAASQGVQVLRNEQTELDGLAIFGIDDYWTPAFAGIELLEWADPASASLCLCHNPDVCDLAGWERFHGVIFSGHTHGGQCKPPFLPPPMLPVRNRRYTAGFFDLTEQRRLFITRGVGHTMPVRFNCRPEIAVFRLQDVTPTERSVGSPPQEHR